MVEVYAAFGSYRFKTKKTKQNILVQKQNLEAVGVTSADYLHTAQYLWCDWRRSRHCAPASEP